MGITPTTAINEVVTTSQAAGEAAIEDVVVVVASHVVVTMATAAADPTTTQGITTPPQELLFTIFNMVTTPRLYLIISVRSTTDPPVNMDNLYKVFSAITSLSDTTNVECLVDTGASHHCVNNKQHFVNFDQNFTKHNSYLELADGSKKSNLILAKGTVKLPL